MQGGKSMLGDKLTQGDKLMQGGKSMLGDKLTQGGAARTPTFEEGRKKGETERLYSRVLFLHLLRGRDECADIERKVFMEQTQQSSAQQQQSETPNLYEFDHHGTHLSYSTTSITRNGPESPRLSSGG